MPLLRKATVVITLLGGLATLGLELHAAAPVTFDRSLAAGIGFLAWPLLPFGVVGFTVRLKLFRGLSVAVCLAASVVLIAVSFLAYRPAVLRSSSTAALVFVVVPVWELVGLGAIGFVLGIRELLGRKASRSSGW